MDSKTSPIYLARDDRTVNLQHLYFISCRSPFLDL